MVKRRRESAADRFRLLEPLRQFGRERLREAGDEHTLRSRHRDWIGELAARGRRQRCAPGRGYSSAVRDRTRQPLERPRLLSRRIRPRPSAGVAICQRPVGLLGGSGSGHRCSARAAPRCSSRSRHPLGRVASSSGSRRSLRVRQGDQSAALRIGDRGARDRSGRSATLRSSRGRCSPSASAAYLDRTGGTTRSPTRTESLDSRPDHGVRGSRRCRRPRLLGVGHTFRGETR